MNDDSVKVSKVEKLLQNNHNKNILLDTIIAEIIWVLTSYYSLEKPEVIEKIRALIHVKSVECNQMLISKALSYWEENNISYIDSYLAAVASLGSLPVISYDERLKTIRSIIVSEPK